MRVELDAGVLVAERLRGRDVQQHAAFAFADLAAAHRLRAGRDDHGADIERGVEAMLRVRVFAQHDVAPRLAQPLDIGLAAGHRVVIVGDAVEDPDRLVGDIGLAGVAGGAVRIERDIGRELRARFVPHLVEAVEARIQRGLAAARKPARCGRGRRADASPATRAPDKYQERSSAGRARLGRCSPSSARAR